VNCSVVATVEVMALDVANNKALYIDSLQAEGIGDTMTRALRDAIPKLMSKSSANMNVNFKPIIKDDTIS